MSSERASRVAARRRRSRGPHRQGKAFVAVDAASELAVLDARLRPLAEELLAGQAEHDLGVLLERIQELLTRPN